jgi:DNA-binding GntR family transcriptional regulator
LPKLKTKTKTEEVASHFRGLIGKGRIRPGEPIRIQEWARELGVSVTPLREALRTLEAEGYLRFSSYRGFEVATFTTDDLMDAYRLRRSLNAVATEAAVLKMSEDQRAKLVEKLKRSNEDFRQAMVDADYDKSSRANEAFHRAIYDASGSGILERARTYIFGSMPAARGEFWQLMSESEDLRFGLVDEHTEIIDAIASGDPDRAFEASRHHISKANDALMQRLGSRSELSAPVVGPAEWPWRRPD